MIIIAKSKTIGEKQAVAFFNRGGFPGLCYGEISSLPLLKTVSKLLNLFLHSQLDLSSLLLGKHFPFFALHLSMLADALCIRVDPSLFNTDLSHACGVVGQPMAELVPDMLLGNLLPT